MRYIGFLALLAIVGAVVFRLFFSAAPQMPQGMPQGMAMPAQVAEVVEKEIETWNDFSGRLQATDKVEIRPRVGGNIQKILFEEGSVVQKGQALFVIDQRPYLAEVQRLEATITSATTQAEFANSEFTRADALVKQRIITQSKYDERLSAKQTADANLKAAEAALNIAKLNLEYSTIRAPITGRISRAEITEGNLVDPAANLVLATIVSLDPIYAEFNVDEQTYLKFSGANGDVSNVPVQISLANNIAEPRKGFMKSFDNQLNTTTGTIRARAIFENGDGKLMPGLFATVRMGSAEKRKAILISDRAIGTDQDKKFALVVNAQNKVEYRPLVIGSNSEGLRVVESGLTAGDRVIVSALFKYRPDMEVAPQITSMDGSVISPAPQSEEQPSEQIETKQPEQAPKAE